MLVIDRAKPHHNLQWYSLKQLYDHKRWPMAIYPSEIIKDIVK